MKKEKSAGAIIFFFENEPLYLLLKHNKNQGGHWAFPKGHVEKSETDEETARREIKEETGLSDITIIPGFCETLRYIFKQDKETISKEVVLFLGETKTKKVLISFEHAEFSWLPYKEAIAKVNFKDSKDALTKAHKFVQEANAKYEKS